MNLRKLHYIADIQLQMEAPELHKTLFFHLGSSNGTFRSPKTRVGMIFTQNCWVWDFGARSRKRRFYKVTKYTPIHHQTHFFHLGSSNGTFRNPKNRVGMIFTQNCWVWDFGARSQNDDFTKSPNRHQ